MSDPYFTTESIQKKAAAFLDQLGSYARDFKATFTPENSALIVIDMQKYFLNPSSHAFIPSAPAIIPGIQKLIEESRRLNRPVIFTRHLNTPQNVASLGRWWADFIKEDDPLSEVIDEFDSSKGTILKKSQYDAFYNTDLEQKLRDQNIKQIVICGVMTHLCCETTARSAFVRDFDVFFTIDGTATYDEVLHFSTLLNLSHGFACPVIVQDMVDLIKDRDEG